MDSNLYLILGLFNLIILTSCSSTQSSCHENESKALLQFKHDFVIDKFASVGPSAYPKLESWKILGGKSDGCCSWNGVECDENTGRVIGLDLSSSFLRGSINSNSSLFSLVHLHSLNLADNNFNLSEIPSRIGHLSRLTSLNLSNSGFFGQIPSEISSLSNLVILDLSTEIDLLSESLLKLKKPILRDLAQNLTNLKVLDLSVVNISSSVPSVLSNISSLTTLHLERCSLHGEFPMDIFHLPKLQILNVALNENLIGSLPEFQSNSRLKALNFHLTGFYGKLPDSIGRLESLRSLDFSLANLQGEIPLSLANLTQLSYLVIRANNLVGKIPSWFMNHTQLTHVDLGENHFHGTIPSSMTQLKRMQNLNLGSNSFTGIVELDMFMKLPDLVILVLGGNKLTVLIKNSTNGTIPKLSILGLASCNLVEFPSILRFQDELQMLSLDNNKIRGKIPTWVWNSSKETMEVANFHQNFLTGFEQMPAIIPWRFLKYFDFSSNKLQGSLPVPPPSIVIYTAQNNALTGTIPLSMCHMNSLYQLDLSNNNLNGTIPPCLASSSENLLLLNLSGNSFQGNIPSTFTMKCQLVMIDLGRNQLHGLLPRSLANCSMLECLVLQNNQIEDTFPSWLGALPKLELLVLESNKFHGDIGNPANSSMFPKLRIIDLSCNGFSGNLPTDYIRNWNGMKMINKENLTYMHENQTTQYQIRASPTTHATISWPWTVSYQFSMRMVSKGTQRLYERILTALVVLNLSNNKFVGDIPEALGSLTGLQLLNISNNKLTSAIPSSLAKLIELESLDLSQNLLSGHIPWQLTQLTFLSILNVSHNQLAGPIPRGNQFDTFENSSYDWNLGLCGVPLSKLCKNSMTTPPPPPIFQGNDSEFSRGIYWTVIALGYGSGLVIGLVIGTTLTRRYQEWFVNTFGRGKKFQKKQKRNGRRT